jgi:hypothetical protein
MTLLPKHGPWWYTGTGAEVNQQEWRPSGGVYLCPGEPADVFSQRMRALKSWLQQRPEVTLLRGFSLFSCINSIVTLHRAASFFSATGQCCAL